jgi:hypothetical protein
MTKLEKNLTAILLWVIVGPLISIWGGFVLNKLWAWFIVNQFGVCPLSIPQAIGINIITHYLTVNRTKTDDNDALTLIGSTAIFWVLYGSIALLFGYIVSLFL